MADQYNQKHSSEKNPVVIAGLSSKKKKRNGIFFTLGVVIFVLAVASAVGLFFWQQQVIGQNDLMIEQLEEEKAKFDADLVREFTNLKSKIESSSALLDNHISVSNFLELFRQITVTDVRFSNFNFAAVPGGGVNISMSGEAVNYSSLAFQSQVFKTSPLIRNVTFSGLNLSPEGNVVFSVAADIDPEFVTYRSTVAEDLEEAVLPEEDQEDDEEVTETETETEDGESEDQV